MVALWDGVTEISLNGRGHMTKKASMPIYGKNHPNFFFPRTTR